MGDGDGLWGRSTPLSAHITSHVRQYHLLSLSVRDGSVWPLGTCFLSTDLLISLFLLNFFLSFTFFFPLSFFSSPTFPFFFSLFSYNLSSHNFFFISYISGSTFCARFTVEMQVLRVFCLIGAETMKEWDWYDEREEKKRKCLNFSSEWMRDREIVGFLSFLFFLGVLFRIFVNINLRIRYPVMLYIFDFHSFLFEFCLSFHFVLNLVLTSYLILPSRARYGNYSTESLLDKSAFREEEN